jgi:hypothetical protein
VAWRLRLVDRLWKPGAETVAMPRMPRTVLANLLAQHAWSVCWSPALTADLTWFRAMLRALVSDQNSSVLAEWVSWNYCCDASLHILIQIFLISYILGTLVTRNHTGLWSPVLSVCAQYTLSEMKTVLMSAGNSNFAVICRTGL